MKNYNNTRTATNNPACGFDAAIQFLEEQGITCPEAFREELKALLKQRVIDVKPSAMGSGCDTLILWGLKRPSNEDIQQLLSRHSVDIKEVEVVFCKEYVLATNSFHKPPHSLFAGPLFNPLF